MPCREEQYFPPVFKDSSVMPALGNTKMANVGSNKVSTGDVVSNESTLETPIVNAAHAKLGSEGKEMLDVHW